MSESLNMLLEHASLHIQQFDIHSRRELKVLSRVLPYYVMSYHKEGKATLRIGDVIYPIDTGHVVLIPPNIEHDHYKDTNEESVFLWWHFTFQIAGLIDVFRLFQLPLIFKLENTSEFEQAFLQFQNSANSRNAAPGFLPTRILEKAKSLELLYHILVSAMNENAVTRPDQHSNSFLDILAQIIQHPEQELSLGKLAQKIQMHPTYVSNRFKELFGKSPIQVHREMRVLKAKTLLQTSDLSIGEIALAAGFSGIPTFSRLFKSYVGVPPSQYRELNKPFGFHT
ncbi:AraC family transcriptional regulator [Paenibacillus sp. OV219]|uniref:AraC family transcriptional regulator n=1 Tax=Paenibacillus sp. OV219 TaxID=1884377 RepID=UPI0008CB6F8A|nr:AraC family transcriptional regulator [Paenibacillus sp. OV219]SEO87551.1 AraC-type DNA-binding protein [Paenibacillus sp. OV219]